MLESGNPSIFTSDVSAPCLRSGRRVPAYERPVLSISPSPTDHLRLTDHETGPQRDRVAAQGHHEAGDEHPRAARDVHGHGHVRGDAGAAALGAVGGEALREPWATLCPGKPLSRMQPRCSELMAGLLQREPQVLEAA